MDNKLSELKRRADKCPIKRFKAFIGKANTQATLCADTGIEIIGWSGFDASDLNAKSHRVELARFIAAADPETVLALLAELEAKDKRIAELEAIRAAAEKLVRCKGRYHSEQNYRALSALFGVTTPDLPPVDGDSEVVIAELRAKLATPVRLPTEHELHQVSCSECAGNCLEMVETTIRAAGFKVEGDE